MQTAVSDQREIVITSLEEANAAADEVMELQSQIKRIDAEREIKAAQAMKAIREKYEPQLKEKGELALAKFDAVQKWLEANRTEVLGTGEEAPRSFQTTLAEVGFRWNPEKLVPASGLTMEKVLERIKGLKKFVKLGEKALIAYAERFVRTKEEVAIDTLKKDIKDGLVDDESRREIGVVLKREEKFYICAR